MTATQPPVLDLGGYTAPVTTLEAFMQDDPRRADSFITNFGNWHLPPAVAQVMRSLTGHVELSYGTGELFLIGAVPVIGTSSVDVPPALASHDPLGGLGGGESVLVTHQEVSPGLVREFFPAETVPNGTAIAVLATFEHGWTAHEVLWGWHEHHRDDDGWDWLIARLASHR